MAVEGEMVRVRNAVKTYVLNTSESKSDDVERRISSSGRSIGGSLLLKWQC